MLDTDACPGLDKRPRAIVHVQADAAQRGMHHVYVQF